jgi:ferredoxin
MSPPPSFEVHVDRDRCMGSGNCVFRTPEVFDLDDAGFAIVVGDPGTDEERVRHAVDECPTRALSITSP